VDLDAVTAALAPRLIAYAAARIGSREAAEDVAQDALTALVRRWRLAGPPESPDAFAFAIARRRAGRVIAKRALMVPFEVLRDMVRDEPTVEQTYDDRRELSIVRSALRALPRRDREALLLRAIAELSFEDIAAISRTSPAAVKMRISRARRRLAALLPEHEDGRRTRTARG
jgi:RNA polymerase sigma-70 factor (ECF subfamily)